ncbi:COPII coat Sec23p-Sfb3p heterodimer component [Basidiobolus ranarum]|uniref:COPII coat Sec23p-Sfb3p heterodimer component n=1 Tax=Basidiobolus ranarum TaxID=34480 RepID=A0ABR2W2N5_9FUNG
MNSQQQSYSQSGIPYANNGYSSQRPPFRPSNTSPPTVGMMPSSNTSGSQQNSPQPPHLNQSSPNARPPLSGNPSHFTPGVRPPVVRSPNQFPSGARPPVVRSPNQFPPGNRSTALEGANQVPLGVRPSNFGHSNQLPAPHRPPLNAPQPGHPMQRPPNPTAPSFPRPQQPIQNYSGSNQQLGMNQLNATPNIPPVVGGRPQPLDHQPKFPVSHPHYPQQYQPQTISQGEMEDDMLYDDGDDDNNNNTQDNLVQRLSNLNLHQTLAPTPSVNNQNQVKPKRVFLGPDGRPVDPTGYYNNDIQNPNAPNQMPVQQAQPSLYSPMEQQYTRPAMPGYPTLTQPDSKTFGHDSRRPVVDKPRSRVDPDSIPSPIVVQERNQIDFNDKPYMTCSRTSVPLASTNFKAIDEGCSNPRFMRMTTYNIPATSDLLRSSHLPLGMIVQPLAELRCDEAPIDVVDFGESGPIRCSRCQGYINPFVTFTDGGRRFICNLCRFENEVPDTYFCNLDMNGRRLDIDVRPELKYGTVEFVATKEYCNRPPVPASFIFAIDVSWNAIQSGMINSAAQAIRDTFYSGKGISNGVRVGIITYDRSVHFYNLSSNLEQAQMMVVPDVHDMFVPLDEGFLVDPNQSRSIIEDLLDNLPSMFANNRIVEPALGAAMQSVYMALKDFGGKVFNFHTCLPTFGPGSLESRDIVKLVGTDKETSLFVPHDTFYKSLGANLVESGISVDMFLFTNSYVDIATIGTLATLTGGDIHHYHKFDAEKDGLKFRQELQHNVTRPFGFNGVLRIRCSNGLSVDDHLGNFHMRNATDVEFGGIDSDKAIGVVIKHDSKVDEKLDATFQCALLYTTTTGQRRIRLHNLSVPVTTLMSNMFKYADMDAIINLMVKDAVTQSLSTPLKTVRNKLTEQCFRILGSYRKHCASTTTPGQLILPETLKLFPLNSLTILKTEALRNGVDVLIDSRVTCMRMLKSIGVSQSIVCLYPRLFPVHSLTGAHEDENGVFLTPPMIRDSYTRLETNGAYFLCSTETLMFWIGSQISSEFLQNVFGVSSLQEIDPSICTLPALDNPVSERLRALLHHLQKDSVRYPMLQLVRQSIDRSESKFASLLVEDKNNDNMSYVDYLCFIHRQIQNELSND